MSATGRGAARRTNDFYETPDWLTRAIVPYLRLHPDANILEPSAGAGAIVSVLKKAEPLALFDTMDIDRNHAPDFVGDFLRETPRPGYDLIITNPPYSLAAEFCKKAMEWRRDERSIVAMLLRLNFLGGQRRAAWLRENTPSVFVTPRRPSFTGNGTDATEYAWFVWGLEGPPRVTILETER